MTSWVTASSAPGTLKRCRPEGALIQLGPGGTRPSTGRLPRQGVRRGYEEHGTLALLRLKQVRYVNLNLFPKPKRGSFRC